MTLTDRIFIALLATLFLVVIFVERFRQHAPAHVTAQPEGKWPISLTNVPHQRPRTDILPDVAFQNFEEASEAEQ